nr:MAG TPA: hypothetical protein [Caudoviricetes sp.]
MGLERSFIMILLFNLNMYHFFKKNITTYFV